MKETFFHFFNSQHNFKYTTIHESKIRTFSFFKNINYNRNLDIFNVSYGIPVLHCQFSTNNKYILPISYIYIHLKFSELENSNVCE